MGFPDDSDGEAVNITIKAINQTFKYFLAVSYMFLLGRVSFLISQLKKIFKFPLWVIFQIYGDVLFAFFLLM